MLKRSRYTHRKKEKHGFYDSVLSAAAAAAWHKRTNDFSIGKGRWKAAGEQEHCG